MALDEDSIAKDLGELLTPQPLPYRATIKGKIDTVVITSKQELLLALRKYKDQYNQSILTRILLKVADDKESVWHLSEERFDYSEKMAKRLRAMLHDVQQNLTKYKNKTNARVARALQAQRRHCTRATSIYIRVGRFHGLRVSDARRQRGEGLRGRRGGALG